VEIKADSGSTLENTVDEKGAAERTEASDEVVKEFRQRIYSHLMELGRLQVDAEGMYHNRSSVITLALGMLAVAFMGLVKEAAIVQVIGALCIAVMGFGLSILWLLLEQRNQVYFSARGNVIEELERKVVEEYAAVGVDFPIFWGRVPKDVKSIAKPLQRVSGPMIVRTFIPIVFAVFWVVMSAQSLFVLSDVDESNKKVVESFSDNKLKDAARAVLDVHETAHKIMGTAHTETHAEIEAVPIDGSESSVKGDKSIADMENVDKKDAIVK